MLFRRKHGPQANATLSWQECGMLNSGEGDMTKTIHSFKSVWDALADTPEQAANLHARSGLMRQITEVIEENGWTQMEAGAQCGVTQPRINDLLRGRLSRFSLDALVNMAAALGRPVRVELEHPKHRRLTRVRRSA
jgi:predicted XRE-type DNA-binding protein